MLILSLRKIKRRLPIRKRSISPHSFLPLFSWVRLGCCIICWLEERWLFFRIIVKSILISLPCFLFKRRMGMNAIIHICMIFPSEFQRQCNTFRVYSLRPIWLWWTCFFCFVLCSDRHCLELLRRELMEWKWAFPERISKRFNKGQLRELLNLFISAW